MRDFRTHLLAGSKSERTIKKRMYDVLALGKRLDLATLTTEDIERFLAERRHLAPETRRGMVASWRVYYDWAHRTGRVVDNPTVGLETISIPHRFPRVALDADVQAAVNNAPTDVKAMILLARYGCLRLTELTELPQSARHGDSIRVIGKGNKERIVYLHPELANALDNVERMRPGRYYFPGRFGGALHPMSVNKIITRHTGWNPHSLRHAGATAAYNSTRDMRAVQLMLGHASLATTQRYLHVDEDGMRAAALGTSLQSAPRLRLVA